MATATSSDPRRDKDTNVLNRSGLNPLRVCMSEQLTLSACVCKSAAAEITSDYDRAQAWHSCADQQPASVKKTRDRLRSAGYHSAVHVMAAEERPQMYDAFMSVHCT